jgi:hypothetical protein
MRTAAAAVLLGLGPAIARAAPSPAPAPPPTPRVDLEVGVGAGLAHVTPDGPTYSGDGRLGAVASIGATLSYITASGLGVVGGAELGTGSIHCGADGGCYDFVIESTQRYAAGVRWFARPRFYVQGVALAVHTRKRWASDFVVQWWSYGGAGSVGWRRDLGDAFVDFELRASLHHGEGRDQGYAVAAGGVWLAFGHTW